MERPQRRWAAKRRPVSPRVHLQEAALQKPVRDRRRAQVPINKWIDHFIERAADLADDHRLLRKRKRRALLDRQSKRQSRSPGPIVIYLLQQAGYKENTARYFHPIEHAVTRQLSARMWVQPKGKRIEAAFGIQNSFLSRHIIARFRVFL